MERLLSEADSMNLHYVPFTTDTVLQRAVRLADRHGSNHDRVRARYLLGCAYRDMGEAPQALDCYHQAIDLADTTRADCDYLLLSKIHGQAGDLFQRQALPRNAIHEYLAGWEKALTARDSLTAWLIYGQIASCYVNLHVYDSACVASYLAREKLMQLGDTMSANTFLASPIFVLLSGRDFTKAKTLLCLYEFNSEATDMESADPNYKMLYYYKGLYEKGIGSRDSAAVYLHSFARVADEESQRLLAYSELFDFYSVEGKLDSIKKYGRLSLESAEKLSQYREQSRLQDMQELYNYSRSQRIAHEQQERASRFRTALLFVVFFFGLASLVAYLLFSHVRLQNRQKAEKMSQRYSALMLSLERTTLELSKFQSQVNDYQEKLDLLEENSRSASAETQALQRERDQLTVNLQEAKTQYQMVNKEYKEVKLLLVSLQKLGWHSQDLSMLEKVISQPIVGHLHEKALSGRSATDEDLIRLTSLVQACMPRFGNFLDEKISSRKSKQYYICLFTHLHFSLSEICVLIDSNTNSLNVMRRHLLERMFCQKGGAKDFDEKIRLYPDN